MTFCQVLHSLCVCKGQEFYKQQKTAAQLNTPATVSSRIGSKYTNFK